ncbi:polysaccharide deacetylase family protein [Clostridium sp. D53t1_180928_C8]|uniref:polysaccharide deacetylase family protein n=1 Tax=Clostridium sp. D53t1_180928_C8 TaxID=2787101 RepID=UPI0018AA22EC|nr:polysaccharide deacetylase family protein [Clostridium sp. D53t1_180928_C8]
MKKFLVVISFILLMTLGIVSCGKNEESNKTQIDETNNEQQQTNNDVEKVEEDKSEEVKVEEKEIEYINIAPEEVRIPILMYHSISDQDPNNNLLVPPSMFEEQMAWLEANGFTAMNLDEALEAMETGKVPKRPVVITFDDGYSDNYTSAFPSLKNHGLKATFFVITDGVDNGYYMSSDMLKEMQAAGMSIESHTANHLELDKLSREDAYDSIKRGQDFLRNNIGSDGNYLCYPVGKYNDETIEIQKELGIKAATTTKGGISSIGDGLHQLKRVRIYPMSIESFSSIFSEYIY